MISSTGGIGTIAKPLPQRRRRPAHSCVECRRRKIKCNRKNPCNHCTSARKPTECTYTPNLPPRGATSQKRSISPRPLRGSYPSPLSASDVATDQVLRPPRAPSHVETPISTAPLEDRTRDDLVRRLHTLETLFSTSHPEHYEAFESTPPLQRLKDGRALLNKTRMYGRSHWTSTVCEV